MEVSSRVEATAREDRPFELAAIDLEEPGEVSGVVVDAAGRPVAGARVAVGIAPAYLPAGALPAGLSVTDSSGSFVLRGVRPGRVDVEAYAADVGRGQAVLQVQSGRPTRDVRIALAGGKSGDEPASLGGVAVTLGESGDPPEVDVVIVHVADGSEAERSGLVAGDRLVSIDGQPVTGMNEARVRLGGPVSSDLVLGILRGDERLKRRVARENVRR
jgi:S1-C subfamily serine protease